MRGKPGRGRCQDGGGRIIPAHAGQTTPVTLTPPLNTDHPRACGANTFCRTIALLKDGSSPRMRGKPARANRLARNTRIIPAHAGQTRACLPVRRSTPDHPRACGANLLLVESCVLDAGSSPRMRGKRPAAYIEHRPVRIIPAHAGQTNKPPRIILNSADHPRACGANVLGFL